jgi:hypothetical protein
VWPVKLAKGVVWGPVATQTMDALSIGSTGENQISRRNDRVARSFAFLLRANP